MLRSALNLANVIVFCSLLYRPALSGQELLRIALLLSERLREGGKTRDDRRDHEQYGDDNPNQAPAATAPAITFGKDLILLVSVSGHGGKGQGENRKKKGRKQEERRTEASDSLTLRKMRSSAISQAL